VAMWSLIQLKGMVDQEARDFVRFRLEPHGIALERGSVVSVMEEVCREQIIMELFWWRVSGWYFQIDTCDRR